jgi:eukaryotic-like serine/threonine-protein kinase
MTSTADGRPAARARGEAPALVADRLRAPDSLRVVGRFAVEGVLGEGGSGRVLRARHPLLGIPVALKMLSPALALCPEAAHDFLREASLLAQLEHPGIVRVLDAFEALGTFFIVMPWVEGATLRDHLDRGPAFTAEQVLRVADEGLAALGALHGAGLVHRDVKPSNALINDAGRLVLIDLGIACARGTAAPARRLVGSPTYCSPEQLLGRPVDGRSDVYSLGCTLYELVFGRPPFDAGGIDGAVDGHLRGTPSFDLAPRVPMGEPFLRWLRRCLSRTRANRPDAATARAELRHLLARLLPPPVPERGAWRARADAALPVLRDTVEWRVGA